PTRTSSLSLHDALPISEPDHSGPTPTTLKIIVEYLEQGEVHLFQILVNPGTQTRDVIRMLASELGSTDFELYHHPAVLPFEYPIDRKSTRLNSSHEWIS